MDNKDKNQPLSSTTWRAKFREKLGVDLYERDIHNIFKEFGITPYETKRTRSGKQINGYRESDVNDLMQRGKGLENALRANGVPWEKGQEILKTNKKPFIQYTKSKIPTYKYEAPIVADPEDFQQPKQEYVSTLDIQPSYKNDENDMEKYSDYLIQQYQYENYRPKKVIITESQFRKLLNIIEDK